MKKRMLSLSITLLLVLTFFTTTAFTNTPSAHAMSLATNPPNTTNSPNSPDIGGYYYAVVTDRCGNCEYQFPYEITVGPGTSASISENWTASNSWGANVGITADEVSAAVNFSVTQTTGVTETCNAPINDTGHNQTLMWESYYDQAFYDVYWRDSAGSHYTGTGYAEAYDHPGCRLIQQ